LIAIGTMLSPASPGGVFTLGGSHFHPGGHALRGCGASGSRCANLRVVRGITNIGGIEAVFFVASGGVAPIVGERNGRTSIGGLAMAFGSWAGWLPWRHSPCREV